MPIKRLKNIFVLIPAIIFALALLAALSGWLWRTPVVPPPPQNVTMVEAKIEEGFMTYEILGVMEADLKVDLLARVSGFLKGVKFKEGDSVKAGDVLFEIEPDQYEAAEKAAEAALMSAKADFVKASLDYSRAKDLYQKRAAPKSDFDTAEAALTVASAKILTAEAGLTQASLNLDYATVRAPFDGEISETPFSEGGLLGPESGVLATLVSLDPILVNFGISDKYMAPTRAGNGPLPGGRLDNVEFRLKIDSETFYPEPGELYYVAPLVDKATDTVRMKVKFKNPKGALRPNQSVVVSLTAKEPPKVLLVDKGSVMSSVKGTFVYKAELAPPPFAPEGAPKALRAVAAYVKLGREFENGYEILEGLAPGDKVISLGLMSRGATLREGAEVAIVEAGAKAEAGADAKADAKADADANAEAKDKDPDPAKSAPAKAE